MAKESRELIRWARGRGWEESRTARGHIRFTKGPYVVICPGTGGKGRGYTNCMAQMNRYDALLAQENK